MDIVERARLKSKYIRMKFDADLFDEMADEIERLRDALKKVDTLQMALLLIAEDGLHDPTVKNFIISALKGNE